jgi:hypothetical protein
MIKNIINIQKIYRKKLFFKNISFFQQAIKMAEKKYDINLFEPKDIQDLKNHDNLAKLLRNKNFILKSQKIFNNFIYNINIKDTKILLCIFIIVSYPQIILGVNINNIEKNRIEYLLYNKALKIFNYLKNPNKININSTIYLYFCYFDIFMIIDKQNKIQELINEYCNMSITIEELQNHPDEIHKKLCIGEIEKSKNKIFNLIKTFDNNITKNQIDNIYKIYDKVNKNIENIFWDNFSQDINNKNYDQLFLLLDEIKNNIVKLNKNIIDEINQKIDLDLIKNILKSQNLNNNMVLLYVNYFLHLILESHSPYQSKLLSEKIKDFNKLNIDTTQLLIEGLKLIYHELNILLLNIKLFI